MGKMLPVALVATLLHGGAAATKKKGKHDFDDNEVVPLWFNQVGPYNNPQETYQYFDLPFCRPPGFHTVKKKEGLGEVLEGNELVDSNLDLRFKTNVQDQTYCTLQVDKGVEAEFIDAVQNLYWYQIYLDDLPQWGMVGEWIQDPENPEKSEGLMYTHKNIDIGYTGNRIMQVNLTSERPEVIARGTSLKFTYSVEWKPVTGIKWEERFKRYLDNNFFEHQIHWFSIFNSFMMVIFLTGLVTLILMRTLRHDYAKYAAEDEGFDQHAIDESGWKQVHGDVFRTPSHLSLLCAIVGNGVQLTALIIIVIQLAIIEHLYTGRGSTVTVGIVFYALVSRQADRFSAVRDFGPSDTLAHSHRRRLSSAGLCPARCTLAVAARPGKQRCSPARCSSLGSAAALRFQSTPSPGTTKPCTQYRSAPWYVLPSMPKTVHPCPKPCALHAVWTCRSRRHAAKALIQLSGCLLCRSSCSQYGCWSPFP